MEFKATWDMYDIRNACIKNNWFTCGDCETYNELLKYVDTYDCTPSTLRAVAKAITWNSTNDYDDFEAFVANIEFIILNDYCTHFVGEEVTEQ